MILENGTIRTMDPSLPTARALAIAGERVVGRRRDARAALPSPERVDLGGRCVAPGLHRRARPLPDLGARAAPGAARGLRSLERGRRARRRTRPSGAPRDAGSSATAGAAATGARVEPAEATSTRSPATFRSRYGRRTATRSGSTRPRSPRAHGDLAVPGGVVELDERGEPTGVLREESAWRFRERHIRLAEDEYVDAMRAGDPVAHSRGVTAVHDKDGWLGALPIWQRLQRRGALTLRVWQSLPHERLDELEALGLRSGLGDDLLRLGYLKAFMDGTLGSGTAWMLDGSGVVITSRRGARGDRAPRRARRAGRSPSMRSATARTATRSTRSRRRAGVAAPRPAPAHRARAAPRPDDVAALRRDRRRLLRPVQPRAVGPRPRRALLGRPADGAYAFRSLRESGAVIANGSDAPIEELDPLAGIRAGVAAHARRPRAWRPEQALTVEEALRATTVEPGLARGRRAPPRTASTRLARRPRRRSTATPCVRPEELGEVEVVATMVGGRWVHNPPPWDEARPEARRSGWVAG